MKTNILLPLVVAAALTACSDKEPEADAASTAADTAAQPQAGSSAVLSRSEVSYDDSGKVISSVTYTDPGADGVWYTEDDVAAP